METEQDWIIDEFPGMVESVGQALGDLLFSEEDEGAPNMQRGVQDMDAEEGDICLSPIFLISDVGSGEEILYVQQSESEVEGSKWLSPKRLFASNIELVQRAAMCTFRMEGSMSSHQSISVPGTSFSTTSTSMASALHMRYNEVGFELDMWRVARAYPMPLRAFRDCLQIKRMQLKLGGEEIWQFPCGVLMQDPISSEPYAWQNQEQYLAMCDVGFWDKDGHNRFEAKSKPKLLHNFSDFWLPLSLKKEALRRPELSIEKNPACAMVSYPAFSSLKQKMESNDRAIQQELFKEYRFLFHDDITKKIEEKARHHDVSVEDVKKGGAFKDFRTSLSLESFFKLKALLSSTFGMFKDGDCVCSIGRVVAFNETMVATSLSSLPGSSGAALFLLGLPVDKMFFGVQNAPSKGNYNLATSVDNPSFVLGYIKHEIGKLPLPSSPYWRQNDVRYELFVDWLNSHLELLNKEKASIVREGQDWTKEQRDWLQAAMQSERCRTKLNF